ncbi:hypothetical protein VTN77DRAFT_203 [Rasamsonia byssochlamydoides]|uniref:uncharacterized protein n=1 Tax=Rasamsonia byssochlamydoides TaxID=89139 RepID=UPI00374448C8
MEYNLGFCSMLEDFLTCDNHASTSWERAPNVKKLAASSGRLELDFEERSKDENGGSDNATIQSNSGSETHDRRITNARLSQPSSWMKKLQFAGLGFESLLAVENQDFAKIARLLHSGVPTDGLNKDRRTVLGVTVVNKDQEMLQLLLELGTSENQEQVLGHALGSAIKFRNWATARTLVENGATIHAITWSRRSLRVPYR